jgi:hypothetical protein
MAHKRFSAAMIAYGERIAKEQNMGTLHPGEHLPYDYFSPLRSTGKIAVPGNARVREPSPDVATVDES